MEVQSANISDGREFLREARVNLVDLITEERANGTGKKYILRGEYARVGVPTANGRVYNRGLWEKEIQRLTPLMQSRAWYGEMDHPTDGRSELKRSSHIVRKLWLEGEIVMGEMEVLSTTNGRELRSILDDGCRVGVSSRAFGRTIANEHGQKVVQEDWNLMAFDVVADPADKTAYPGLLRESVDPEVGGYIIQGMGFDEMERLPESAPVAPVEQVLTEAAPEVAPETSPEEVVEEAAAPPAAIEAVISSLSAPVPSSEESAPVVEASEAPTSEPAIEEAQGPAQVEEQIEVQAEAVEASEEGDVASVTEQVIEKLQHFTDAEQALSRVAQALRPYLKESTQPEQQLQTRISELEEENQQLKRLVERTTQALFVECAMRDEPDAKILRESIGNPVKYESLKVLKEAVKRARSVLEARQAQELREAAIRAEARREMQESQHLLEAENVKLRSAAKKALEALKMTEVREHIEERLRLHPKADQIRAIFRGVEPTTIVQADQIIESFRPQEVPLEKIQQRAANVRRLTGLGGYRPTSADEERSAPALPPQHTEQVEYDDPVQEFQPSRTTARTPIQEAQDPLTRLINMDFADVGRLMPPGILQR